MRIKLSIISVLVLSIGFSQELPKSIRVHFSNFIESYKYSNVSLEEAFTNSDSMSYETTDCHYVLDLNYIHLVARTLDHATIFQTIVRLTELQI